MGGTSDQRPHPSFSCTGQGGAQSVVTVVQLPVGLPDDKIQVVKVGTGQDFHFYFSTTRFFLYFIIILESAWL